MSMSLVDTRIALESKLNTGWTATPIKWQNVPFDVPVDSRNNPLPYIAHVLRGSGSEDIVLGSANPEQRYTGIIMVQIFTPENIGMGIATQYAELIKNIYLTAPRQLQYNNSGIIRLYAPYAVEAGTVNGWNLVNVITPFKRDAHP